MRAGLVFFAALSLSPSNPRADEDAPHSASATAGAVLWAVGTAALVASSAISFYSANGPLLTAEDQYGPVDGRLALGGALLLPAGGLVLAAGAPLWAHGLGKVDAKTGRKMLVAGATLTAVGATVVLAIAVADFVADIGYPHSLANTQSDAGQRYLWNGLGALSLGSALMGVGIPLVVVGRRATRIRASASLSGVTVSGSF